MWQPTVPSSELTLAINNGQCVFVVVVVAAVVAVVDVVVAVAVFN